MEITIYIRPLLPDTFLIGNLFLDTQLGTQCKKIESANNARRRRKLICIYLMSPSIVATGSIEARFNIFQK